MKTFAIILSTVSVAFATYLPGRTGTGYITRQVRHRALQPGMGRPRPIITLPPGIQGILRPTQTVVNPIAAGIRQGQALWDNRGGRYITPQTSVRQGIVTSIQNLRQGIPTTRIINQGIQTNMLPAGAFSRSGSVLARTHPYVAASSIPRSGFMGTLSPSPNGGFSVTPLSRFMNAGSSAVATGDTGMTSSFIGGTRWMSGRNAMNVNGIQGQSLNPYIFSGGSF